MLLVPRLFLIDNVQRNSGFGGSCENFGGEAAFHAIGVLCDEHGTFLLYFADGGG